MQEIVAFMYARAREHIFANDWNHKSISERAIGLPIARHVAPILANWSRRPPRRSPAGNCNTDDRLASRDLLIEVRRRAGVMRYLGAPGNGILLFSFKPYLSKIFFRATHPFVRNTQKPVVKTVEISGFPKKSAKCSWRNFYECVKKCNTVLCNG